MKTRMTLVVEFESEAQEPRISAATECLGGKVKAVAFYDALRENEKITDALQKLIDAEERFVAESGQPWADEVTEEVQAAKRVLSELR